MPESKNTKKEFEATLGQWLEDRRQVRDVDIEGLLPGSTVIVDDGY